MKSMMAAVLVAAVALVGVAAVAAEPARAATVDSAHAAIDAVRAQLAGTAIDGRNADRIRAGLESKLDGADGKLDSRKLVVQKLLDAQEKLTAFGVEITELATPNDKGEVKMDSADASALLALLATAQAEVQALIDGFDAP